MAWRSWNAYHTDMNQSMIMAVVDEVAKERKEGISLASLGYDMVGIDEGWEGCGQGAHHTQHYANGTPAVNIAKFPDLKALVAYGHSKGVKMGFYLNGCACGEREELRINYEGDVNFTHSLGFDGVKIDSCGQQRNMTLYAELFNKTRRPIIIENCHQGQSFPDGGDPGQMGPGWCPYNLFRTSGDIINVWDRVIENLMSVRASPPAAPMPRPRQPRELPLTRATKALALRYSSSSLAQAARAPRLSRAHSSRQSTSRQPRPSRGIRRRPLRGQAAGLIRVRQLEPTPPNGQHSHRAHAEAEALSLGHTFESESRRHARGGAAGGLRPNFVRATCSLDPSCSPSSGVAAAAARVAASLWPQPPHTTRSLVDHVVLCVCVCVCVGRAQQSEDESASHFAAWAMVSSPLVLGFDLTNSSRLAAAWPTISNRRVIAVSQSWEAGRADPSGALLASWQAPTLPAVVAGCGPGCACIDKNVNCSRWAKQMQCVLNPGYMYAICPASCPSTSNQTGWNLRDDGSVLTPSGDCLDAAGQLPAKDAGLNWLRTRPCDSSVPTQQWTYAKHRLKSAANGLCLGMMSHWLWPQPMVSLLGCDSRSTNLTLHTNGTMSSPSSYGCFGVSDIQGPLSSIWRKPVAGGQTAVLAINGAALPHTITINVSQVLHSEALAVGQRAPTKAKAVDVWTGEALGVVDHVTRLVRPHGNIFITLEPDRDAAESL